MPALRAAIGSFHVKSATTYFVMVLVTVRVLPFFLTVVLIRSVTLFVSTLGVRSYSDQRYSSMQMSTTRHSSSVSTGRAAGCGSSVAGSPLNRDTSRTRVSCGGVGRESGKGASRWDVAAAVTEAIAAASGAPTRAASALEVVAPRVAPRFQIGVAVFSRPDASKPPSLAAHQPARVTVPHNSTSANRRDLTTRSPPPVRLRRKARRTPAHDRIDCRLAIASCNTRNLRVITFPKRVAQIQRGSRR